MGPTEDTVAAIKADGVEALGLEADVSYEDSVNQAVEQVAETLGAPTVLVNNAGVLRDNLLFKMTHEEFDKVLSVHLGGAFLMAKAVQSYMVEEKFGRIISMSSTSALGNRGQTNYSAAKSGIQGTTMSWATELGKYRVTAKAIPPVFIDSANAMATAARVGLCINASVDAAAKEISVARSGEH